MFVTNRAYLFYLVLHTTITMYLNIAIGVLISIISLKSIDCYFINIDAHAEECFFDKVTSGTKMSLMFEVAEGGFLDIDVKVRFYFTISLNIGFGL